MFRKILLSTLLLTPTLAEVAHIFTTNNCDQIIKKLYFQVCYSYKHKGALAVGYTLNKSTVNQTNLKKRPSFWAETLIPFKYRTYSKDYTKSGYDRGHMAPDASFDYDQRTLKNVYSMANIVPQVPSLNRTLWAKSERYARTIAVKLGSVDVLNQIIYGASPRRIGTSKLSVPAGFWKILKNEKAGFEQCFYFKNKKMRKGAKLKDFVVKCP